jgi:hypothetical protein
MCLLSPHLQGQSVAIKIAIPPASDNPSNVNEKEIE